MAGTETRQRRHLLQIRLTAEEAARIADAADRAGLTSASFARERLLEGRLPRSVRQPPVDRTRLARLLALAGQIAEDLRALVRRLPEPGHTPIDAGAIEACLDTLRDLRDGVITALGREP